jgi:transposase
VSNLYPTDLSDLAWALVSPLLQPAGTGGRRRTTDLRAVLDAIFFLLRTGCQWRLLPRDFPVGGTEYHDFRMWKSGLLSGRACVLALAWANRYPDLKVRTALDRAASRTKGKFDQQPQVEAATRDTIGQSYGDLGLYLMHGRNSNGPWNCSATRWATESGDPPNDRQSRNYCLSSGEVF